MSDKARVTVSDKDKLHLGFRSVSVAFLLVNADTEWSADFAYKCWSGAICYFTGKFLPRPVYFECTHVIMHKL